MTGRLSNFQLERLTLAYTAPDSKTPHMRVLARTPGIQPEHVVECRRVAQIAPPRLAERAQGMLVSLGLFRGETVDYIIAKAAPGPNDTTLVQYVLLPLVAMRQLGGNLRALDAFAREPITAESGGPLSLNEARPPDAATQSEDLLALISYCKNKIKSVGDLLAGLVQGMGLCILNAPAVLSDRLTFVQGLLTLLPAPARAAVTFATSVADPYTTRAQIKFVDDEAALERHLRYDWQSGRVLDAVSVDEYTKFIISQLRLDTSMVVSQTDKLSRTVAWKLTLKETLANALAYGADRASLDQLVVDGLPADPGRVAEVLRADPSLTPELRLAYARHLMAFALAEGDASSPEVLSATDIIPLIAARERAIGDAVYAQLWTAAGSDRAEIAYKIVTRWLTHVPMGVDVSRWQPLMVMAANARLNALLDSHPAALAAFLKSLLNAPASLGLDRSIMQILTPVRQRAYQSPEVAEAVFSLALAHLPLGNLQRLLTDARLMAQLPVGLQGVFAALRPDAPQPAPEGLLARGAEVFGAEHRPLLLGRLAEWALYARRLDLLDVPTLRSLTRLAVSEHGARFDSLIQNVCSDLGQPTIIKTLDEAIWRFLVELRLARGRYAEAALQVQLYQDNLYLAARHEALGDLVRLALFEAPIDGPARLQALEALFANPLKPIVLAKACVGVLEAHDWSMEVAARRLTEIVAGNPRLIAMLGSDIAMRLLKANANRRDATEALRAANAIVEYALTFDEAPIALIDQVYGLLNWNPDVSSAALGMLREYMRRADPAQVVQLPVSMGAKYGENVRRALDATLCMRLIVGGTDFAMLAEEAQRSAALLIDLALFNQQGPGLVKLRHHLEGIPGGLSDQERERLARNLLLIGEDLLKLYQRQQARSARRGRSDADSHRASMMRLRAAPSTGMEAMMWLGVQLGEGRVATLNLNREQPSRLFGTRSVNILLADSDLAVRLLSGFLAAFPENSSMELDLAALLAEVQNLWSLVSLYKQREIQAPITDNLQSLAQIIPMVCEHASDRALQINGQGKPLYTGRQPPRNVIELLVWLSGYFAGAHVA